MNSDKNTERDKKQGIVDKSRQNAPSGNKKEEVSI